MCRRTGSNGGDQSKSHCDRLGCLISEDQTRDGAQSGALWDDDLPSVLWNIANQIDAIGQLTFVASEADYELRRRAEEGAKEVGHG